MASLEPDRLLDRRRLKRGVAIWRALAIVALVAAALVGAMPFALDEGERVARLWVSGFIEDDPGRDRIVADLRDDDTVKAVVLRLDSAGGTAVGGEALYLSLRSLAEKKPVVAVLGTTATSAAYMAALAADRLLAPRIIAHGLDRGPLSDRRVHRAPGRNRGACGGDPQRAAEGETDALRGTG